VELFCVAVSADLSITVDLNPQADPSTARTLPVVVKGKLVKLVGGGDERFHLLPHAWWTQRLRVMHVHPMQPLKQQDASV